MSDEILTLSRLHEIPGDILALLIDRFERPPDANAPSRFYGEVLRLALIPEKERRANGRKGGVDPQAFKVPVDMIRRFSRQELEELRRGLAQIADGFASESALAAFCSTLVAVLEAEQRRRQRR